MAGALSRWALQLRRHLRVRPAQLAFGALVSTVVTALVLAVPVVSGAGDGAGTALDSSESASSRTAEGTSPVVMGVDGKPVTSATFAGLESAATTSPARPTSEDAAEETAEPVVAAPLTTGPAPGSTSSSAGSASTGSS